MNKPNLFIAGFAKAGTTALFHYMLKHPNVFCNHYLKEPRYFSYENFKKSKAYKYILKNAISSESDYLSLFSKASTQNYIVDGSVYYASFFGIAEKIKKFSPNAKIILAIRNPIDRFYSHYMMHIRNGLDKITFDEFYKNPYSSEGLNLLEIGNYYEHISEYIKVFRRENIYVAIYDELVNTPDIFYKKICNFLDISYVPYDNVFVNISGKPKNSIISLLIKGIKAIIPHAFIRRLPISFRSKINSILYNQKTLVKEAIPEYMKQLLVDYYRKDIKLTEGLLDISLDNWYSE